MAGVVLYIDDSPELPQGFAESLRSEGYELVHAADAEQAVGLVEARRPALVLMELLLTGCDGLDLLEGIRERSPDLPIVVLTRAARLPGLYGQAVALGVSDFLSKPVLASQLLISVREFATPPPPQVDLDDTPSGEYQSPVPSGDLAALPFPELLQSLYRSGATGVLLVSQGQTRIGVQIRNGSPVAVGSGQSRESLPDFLLRSGKLDRGQHQRIAAEARAAGSAREALIGAGLLGEQEVESALRRQAEGLLFGPFGWTTGRYRFAEGRRLRADTALELERDPARLLLDGVLEAAADETIRERMRKLAPLYVTGADPSDGALDGLELTRAQARRLADLGGGESVAELLRSGELDERMLYGLWLAGRIALQREPILVLVDELTAEDEPDSAAETPAAAGAAEPALAPQAALERLARRVLGNDDFSLLQVSAIATEGQRRAACDRLLAQIPQEIFHSPDPELRRLAIRVRDRIEEAWENLKDPETRAAYAVLQHEGRQDREGGADAERALEAESWFRKGNGFLKRKHYDEAVEAFGMAAHLDPDEGEYLSHLGYAMYLFDPQQELVQREAMEHIANGIKRSPDRELSYVFLGRLLRGKGDAETARKVLRKALRINPDCHPAHQELRLLELREQKGKGLLGRLWRR